MAEDLKTKHRPTEGTGEDRWTLNYKNIESI